MTVAHGAGISHTDVEGSGLRSEIAYAADAFSTGDVDALRRFSGC